MAISGMSGSFSSLNQTATAQERAQKLLEAMDSDADGKVSKQEFAAMGEKMKANGPRRMEGGDAAAAKGANAPARPSADTLFAKADKDGNGSLSVDDLSAMITEHETHAAARGKPPAGGPPTGGAPPAGAAGGAGASKAAEEPDPADTNGDGNVSAAEKLIYELMQSDVDAKAS
jgi:EF hand